MLKRTMTGTLMATGMVLFIIAGAKAFANVLAYSGASMGLSEFAAAMPVVPIVVVIAMLIVSTFLGMFMGASAIMMICLPIFVPIVLILGFSDVWFAAMFLLSLVPG